MLHLASKSPRRRELLARLGVPFAVLDVDILEVRASGEGPRDYVARVAREKAEAGLARIGAAQGAIVIGADTEVVLDDEVFGKPADAADAAAMLGRLSGRVHQVVSAVSVHAQGRRLQALSVSEVAFAPLSDARIADYVASGEPMGKAGGYAIQGGAEVFVARLSGSYSGVMGLPLFETAGLLRELGIEASHAGSARAHVPVPREAASPARVAFDAG